MPTRLPILPVYAKTHLILYIRLFSEQLDGSGGATVSMYATMGIYISIRVCGGEIVPTEVERLTCFQVELWADFMWMEARLGEQWCLYQYMGG